MNQPVQAGFQFHEAAVFLDLDHLAFDDVADAVFLVDDGPGLGLGLFEAEGNLALFGVHGKHFDLNGLSDLEDFLRVLQFAPGNLGDVQKPVDSADVHESAIIGEPHDSALDDVPDADGVPDFFHELLFGFLQVHLAGKDRFAPALVDPGNPDAQRLANELGGILHVFVGELGQGDEALHFLVGCDDAAVDLTQDIDVDQCLVLIGGVDLIPVLHGFQFLSGEQDAAVPVVGFDDFCVYLVPNIV